MEENREVEEAKKDLDLINAFSEITSSSKEEAAFFLESHNFDLDSAVSTFLETTADDDSLPATAPSASLYPNLNRSPPESPSFSPSSSPSRSRSPSPPPSDRLQQPINPYNLRSRQSQPSRDKKPSVSRPRGIHTMLDLNRQAGNGGDSGSDSDEPQEYYTGGQKSGMLVQDPSKVNDVEALFNQARQSGAAQGSIDHLQPSSSSRSFSGRGRLLSGETVSAVPQEPDVLTHTITFWTNGFTVDDGPFRRLDDPANASFLESIRKSECPEELKPANRRSVVQVSLVRKMEDYPVPKKRQNAFQGMGRTLASAETEDTTFPATDLNIAPAPSMGLVVDETLPSTSIQLRLVDGTRMVSRFNYHHTISDIRSFIDASRPGGQRAYQLQIMGFPPKQLTDLNQTIEQAGLANSVVIQKL